MTTFEEFRKTEQRSSKAAAAGPPARPAAAAAPHGAAPSRVAGSGGERMVSEYVKRQLQPHVKDSSISKEQYDKIKEKWVWGEGEWLEW